MSTIRQHIRELHPQIRTLPRSNDDLARAHARAHHHLHCNHTHEEDGAGALIGPGSDARRPSGWWTGLDVIMRDRPFAVPLTPDV